MANEFNPLLYITRFDKHYESCSQLYDNLPYERDYDACNGPMKDSKSGNIVKYYLYQLKDASYTIKDKPELMAKRIQQYREEMVGMEAKQEVEDMPKPSDSGITSEQMESLLADQDEETDESSPS